ncbi:MAG: hypothetical protein U0232_24340 [Thermomicrobiales bacterium]
MVPPYIPRPYHRHPPAVRAVAASRGEGLLLAAILAVAAALNCIGLAAEGYASNYYAATVKSMLTSASTTSSLCLLRSGRLRHGG